MALRAPEPMVNSLRARLALRAALDSLRGQSDPDPPSLLAWSQQHRFFGGQPMAVPHPLHEIYDSTADYLVFMKGAQIGASEYGVNLAMWTADTRRAGRGNALYVMPSGASVGDFVQARVDSAIEGSPYLSDRVRPVTGGRSKDPDKVGLKHIGAGYTYWRTAGGRGSLKSVDADTVILDEYDEMHDRALALARHRTDSSLAPMLRIISTPTYPGGGVDREYLGGTQSRYLIACPMCATEQPLDWEQNVDGNQRVCRECRSSLEGAIAAAWDGDRPGRWQPRNPDAPYPSYSLSRLYRPSVDIAAIREALESSDVTKQQEAWNQDLGLPFSPPGGQLSREELRRLCTAPFTFAQIAGVQGCTMGVDVGVRMHVWITWTGAGEDGITRRYLVAAEEVDSFEAVDALMTRYGVVCAVVDARPDLHAAQAFKAAHRGRVYLAEYVNGRMPPLIRDGSEPDPKRQYIVQVDRTGALDAFSGLLRSEGLTFPVDAESKPGLFAHLEAPVRKLERDAQGNPRAVYDEGSRPDHFAHAGTYCELASFIANVMPQTGTYDPRDLSVLGQWERGGYQ